MGRRPIKRSGAMTPAEYQARWRLKKKRQTTGAEKRAKREARLQSMRAPTVQAMVGLAVMQAVYGVIYADPPWRFEPYSRETGMDRAADNHYSTMPTAEIKAIRVPAAKDCVLFLWATAPMLPDALDVMGAWGFDYKTHFVWEKDRIGTGYWTRNIHELLLIGTRGDVPAPLPGEQVESIIPALRGEHSVKPPQFARIIEQMYPNVPRLEMFARGPRPGWEVWGNEAPEAAE